eukprot:1118333-Pelagomonas_calceolata.AAC.1
MRTNGKRRSFFGRQQGGGPRTGSLCTPSPRGRGGEKDALYWWESLGVFGVKRCPLGLKDALYWWESLVGVFGRLFP